MSHICYTTPLIFDNLEDENRLRKFLEAELFAFNKCSEVNFKLKQNNILILHKKFYKKFRKGNPNIPAGLVICAEQESLARYRSIKSNKHKIEKPILKKKLSLQLDHNLYKYKNEEFKFSTLELRRVVKCKPHIYPKLKEYLDKYKICDPLLFEKSGKIWVSFTFKLPEQIIPKNSAIGVDLGIKRLAVLSNGIGFQDKEFIKRKRKLRFLKRQLQSVIESKKSKSAKKKLKKLKRKERNINNNFCHNLANIILENMKEDVLVLEDLRGIKKRKHLLDNKNRISQFPLARLRQILTYKAHLYNKQVQTVNPCYTSQIDCMTHRSDGKRKGCRYYSKNGENVYDADWNAALNIVHRSKLPFTFILPSDGKLKLIRQVDVTQPNIEELNSVVKDIL